VTSRERMILTLNREVPDRVPATLHQWLPYHLDTYMGGMSDIEAFRAVGLDAAITFYGIADETSQQWKTSHSTLALDAQGEKTRHTIQTPEGELTYVQEANAMTSWMVEPLIKHDEDIFLIKKYRPIPTFRKDLLRKKYEALGDGGIMRTVVWGYQGGCWQDAAELVGTEKLIMATFDNPGWVHELLGILLEQKLEYIDKNLHNLPVDLVETGGGAASNTIISPAMHQEFCLPYDMQMHDALHGLGYKVVYHTCGGMLKIMESLLANGCDASETLSPIDIGGDIRNEDMLSVKKTLGSAKVLIGGIDQLTILPSSEEAIRKEVFDKFEGYGTGGGYIMSASDHFFDLPASQLQIYSDAAKECTYS